MPIIVDITTRVDRRSLDDTANDVRRHFNNAGNDISGGLTRGVNQAVSNFTSQFGAMGQTADNVFKNITTKGVSAATVGVAGIGLAAVAVGKQLYDLGAAWDDVTDNMVARTGLVGDELVTLKEGLKDVVRETAAPMEEIGDVFGRVVQSMHLTGDPLKVMVKNISDLNEMTGEKLGIRELSKAFRLFGVDVEKEGVKQLNSLSDASQATGIPLNELITSLTGKGAVAARQFGLDIGETAALLTTFEGAGLPLTESINGLAIALKQVPDQAALGARINEIKRLVDIGDSDGANKLAAKTFGRGFVDFLNAIGTGAIDAQSLDTALSHVGSTIEEERQATADWHEEWQKIVNTLKVDLEPVASSVFSQINEMLRNTTQTIKEEAEIWKETWRNAKFAWDDLWGDPQLPAGTPAVGAPGSTQPNGGVNAGGIPIPGQTPGQATIGGIPIPGLQNQNPGGGRGGPTVGGGRGFGAGSITDQDIARLGGGGGGSSTPPSPAAMAAIAKAQALNGLPYTPGTTDCSGYLSQVYSAMTGTTTHFTTMADFEKLGFHRGYMPGALNIGNTRLPGKSGHMAGTLPNGVNIESGGSSGGVSYDSGPGALGKQFGEQWWFMPGYASGGDVGSFDWQRAKSQSPWKGGDKRGSPFFQPPEGGWPSWMFPDFQRHNTGGGVDTVPAMLTPGEHVLTTDDVKALGGQGGVYALRAGLRTGQIPWPGGPVDKTGSGPGGIPNPAPGRNPARIAFPDWSIPGQGWGAPPPGWFDKPVDPDDILFPDHMPPGRGDWKDYWKRKRIQGYNDGGDVSNWDKFSNPVTGPYNMMSEGGKALWRLAQESGQYLFHFDEGGGVPHMPDQPTPAVTPDTTAAQSGDQMADTLLSGMQQGGGYGGMIAGLIQMGRQGQRGQGQPGMPGGIEGMGPLPGPPPVSGRAPSSVGGTGFSGSSIVDMAGGAAGSMFPGGAAVAQIGTKLANRAIGFGGQAISIGIQGIAETLLPNGSPLGDPSRNWLGKIASGVGGGRAVGENTTGQSTVPMQTPPPISSGQGSGPAPGPAIGQVNFSSPVQDQQSMIRDIDRQVNAHGAGSGH